MGAMGLSQGIVASGMPHRDTIPAIVRVAVDRDEAYTLSPVDNIDRADWNPRDKARAFETLLA